MPVVGSGTVKVPPPVELTPPVLVPPVLVPVPLSVVCAVVGQNMELSRKSVRPRLDILGAMV